MRVSRICPQLAGLEVGGAVSGLTRPDVALTESGLLDPLRTFADHPSLRSFAGHRLRVSLRASPLATEYYLISGFEQGPVAQHGMHDDG